MNVEEMKKRAIYVPRHGSQAYGLSTPSSDLDIKGAFVPPREYYLGFLNRVEQLEEHEPNDSVIYELSKFFKTASDCNPNIIEVLFTDESDIVHMNQDGESLRTIRDTFLSQKAKHTFSGYATSQLKRMVNHHAWMKTAPKPPRDRKDFGLPQSKQWCSGMEADMKDRKTTIKSYSEEIQVQYDRELQWRGQSQAWDNYNTWLAGRNAKRHELEMKFGYDTKHGMHLVRLMRMGHEILTQGKVIVRRPDREELLAIRNEGIWSYDQMVEYAQTMDAKLNDIYEANTSPLPKEPNRRDLDAFCTGLIGRVLDHGPRTLWDPPRV